MTFDPSQNVFILEYVDDSGVGRTVEVAPRNRIGLEAEVRIDTLSNELFAYEYLFRNVPGPNVDQSIEKLEIACPESVLRSELSVPQGWIARILTSGHTGDSVCRFWAINDPIQLNDELTGFRIEAALLPGVVRLLAWGHLPEGAGPLPGIDHVRPELGEILDHIEGITGGWLETQTVGPAIPASQVTNPAASLAYARRSVEQACSLNWIDANQCQALQAGLSKISSASPVEAVRSQLSALIDALDAERDVSAGDEGYALVRGSLVHARSQF